MLATWMRFLIVIQSYGCLLHIKRKNIYFLDTRLSRNIDVKIIFLVELHVRHKHINWFLAEKIFLKYRKFRVSINLLAENF